MGFGILFIGYMLVALGVFVPFGFIMRLGGYALMAIAFLKLREFGKAFIYLYTKTCTKYSLSLVSLYKSKFIELLILTYFELSYNTFR